MIRREDAWQAETPDSDPMEGLARAVIECATAAEFVARAREL